VCVCVCALSFVLEIGYCLSTSRELLFLSVCVNIFSSRGKSELMELGS